MDADQSSSPPRIAPRDALLPGAVILVGLVLVFRGDLLTGSDFFFKATRDISPFLSWYPWSRLAASSWGQGLFPLWNPYEFLGLPLLGNYQSSIFSPLLWPLYLPLEWVTAPYLVGRLWLAGMGAWWLGRRVGQSNAGATIAGVAFGLTGYLVQHVSVQHIVIDLLIPYLIIAGMELLDRPRLRSFLALAGVTALILLGGQPSAALFTFFFGYGFLVLYALAHPGRRMSGYLMLKAAGGVACLIAMIQLLPFFEFIPQAWNFHLPGFGVEYIPLRGAISAIAAGFNGAGINGVQEPSLSYIPDLIPAAKIVSYFGITVVTLAFVGLFRRGHLLDVWLIVCLVIAVSILFGLPPLHSIAGLPGLDKLTFIRYLQPLLAFCLAMLAGRGADVVTSGKAARLITVAFVLLATALVLASSYYSHSYPFWVYHAAGEGLFRVVFPEGRFMWGATVEGIFFILALLVVAGTRSRNWGSARAAACTLVLLVLLELVMASAVNRPLMSRNVAREDFSGVRDAVAVCTPAGVGIPPRAAATDDLLLPDQNLLAPYFEIGGAEAMIPRGSYDYLRAIAGVSEQDFLINFLRYNSVLMPANRKPNAAANLAGLGITLSRLPLPLNDFLETLPDRPLFVWPRQEQGLRITVGEVNGSRRGVLFAHPPLWVGIFAPPKQLFLSAGIDPRVAKLSGDGVWFEVMDGESLKFVRYLDPRKGDGGWVDATANFNRSLALITLPNTSTDNDWAWWGDLRPGGPAGGRFVHGVHAYCDQPPAPRIYLAKKIVSAGTLAEMLQAYAPETAFVPPAALAAAGLSATSAGGKVTAVDYGLQRVTADIAPNGGGLLVLADAYFPGWRAFVDGREQRIIRANHAERAVMVDPADRRVEFVYQPWSFRVGLWLCLASIVAAAVAGVKKSAKRTT